jgi:hypothetical protein
VLRRRGDVLLMQERGQNSVRPTVSRVHVAQLRYLDTVVYDIIYQVSNVAREKVHGKQSRLLEFP